MNIQSVVIISRADLRRHELALEARYNELSKELEALNDQKKFTDKITLLSAMELESDDPNTREKALKKSEDRSTELEIEMRSVDAVINFIRDELLKEEKVNPEYYGIHCAEIP